MKKAVIYFVLVFSVTISCNNTEDVENQENDSLQLVENLKENEPEDKETDGKLESVLKDNKLVMFQLASLSQAIENKNEIKSIEDIENVFKMRDSLISLLYSAPKLDEYMENEDGTGVEEELNKLGILMVWVEGMYSGLEQAAILEDIIEKVADEPYILKNKIENLYASSIGLEYPYDAISEQMQIVPLA